MDPNKTVQNVQVPLDKDQQDYLSRLSNKTGKSLSELAHQLLAERVQQLKEERLARVARELRGIYETKSELTAFTDLDGQDWLPGNDQEQPGKPSKREIGGKTHTQKILGAVKSLTRGDLQTEFSRNDVRLFLGISSHDWLYGYTAIFQAMRSDHPGAAPPISGEYQGVFRRVRRGKYVLTEKGRELISRN
ncbi:MAG: hypothetical protein ACRDFQ_00860 [Anaerolineales bacterium]